MAGHRRGQALVGSEGRRRRLSAVSSPVEITAVQINPAAYGEGHGSSRVLVAPATNPGWYGSVVMDRGERRSPGLRHGLSGPHQLTRS